MGRLAVEVEETDFVNALSFGGGTRPAALGALAHFGEIDGGLVTQYGADVSVFTPSLFGDGASRAILGIADKLASAGFLARVSKVSPGRTYSNFTVTVSKNGRQPFTANAASLAIRGAVAAQSLSLWSFAAAAGEIVAFTAEAPGTALSEKGRQQTFDTVKAGTQAGIDFVGNPICGAIEGATGLNCKTVIVGGLVIAGLFFAWPAISPFITVGAERVARRFR